jgi:hypothetical protein
MTIDCDITPVIEELQKDIQLIRLLALMADHPEQRKSMLLTAQLVEQCVRELDRHL